MDTCYNISHYVPLSPMFCPTQGYPLRFLALTHMYALPTGFQERFHQGPLANALPKHAYNSKGQTSLVHHQPLASTPYKS